MHTTKTAAACSLGAALVLATMLGISLHSGVSQQHFEQVLPVAEYTRDLLQSRAPLRAILTLDALFVALYVAASVLLAEVLASERTRVLTRLSAALVVLTGVLDLVENHHIATMLSMAEQGLALGTGEIGAQAVASMLKWHLGYLAFFFLGCALRPRTAGEKVMRASLLAVQLPLGASYYVAPPALEPVLLWLRYGNLLAGFIVFGLALFRFAPPARAFGESGSASPA